LSTGQLGALFQATRFDVASDRLKALSPAAFVAFGCAVVLVLMFVGALAAAPTESEPVGGQGRDGRRSGEAATVPGPGGGS
jgi:hypothetical protein